MATERKDPPSDPPAEESAAGAEDRAPDSDRSPADESEPPPSADETARDSDGGTDAADGASAPRPRRKRKRKGAAGDAPSSSRGKRRKGRGTGTQGKSDAQPKSKRSRLVAAIVAGLILVVVIGVVVTGRRGSKTSAEPTRDGWTVGAEVPVEITLVAADKANLACASSQDVKGKHCEFETDSKKWSKGGGTDDRSVLKPYTTTDHRNLLAAGLWSESALSGTLPKARFSVRCTFVIEAVVPKPNARWEAAGQWHPNDADWHAGTIKGCSMAK